ncbi:hypothetical protein PHLCEN_2v9320 [Hermanssonia centrifuga]|uniref:CCHC-type domain-containing protein n=1 Tax=Hermanssonia centrifuga TaxID=98765 RepID=A0A2R6NRY7_9APHY|nr:hypothetical protein PHLCEN_2v9320 [Hermanssonia centrifuga]
MHYFNYKKVAEADHVTTIAPLFQSPLVQQWYFANQNTLKATTFDEFMVALRKHFLKSNWVDSICSKPLLSYQSADKSFDNWVESLETTNALLLNTSAVFSAAHLCKHIESHAVEDLHTFAKTSVVFDTKDFQQFKSLLSDVDSKQRRNCSQPKYEFKTCLSSCTRLSVTSHVPRIAGTPLVSGPSAGTITNSRRVLPKLTNAEQKLLSDNKGCLKCQKVNTGHFAKDCPAGFPNPSTYRNLVTGRNAVAAIIEAPSSSPDDNFVEVDNVAAVHSINALPFCLE